MISKAIIELKIDNFTYKVRIPFINKSKEDSNSTRIEDLYEACISLQPGINLNYSIGDVVFVSFELDNVYSPVIVGQLAREGKSNSTSSIECETLQVQLEEDHLSPSLKEINNRFNISDERITKIELSPLSEDAPADNRLYARKNHQWSVVTGGGGGGSATWGDIGGNLSDQTDLQTALNIKENISNKVTSISSSSTNTQYPSAKAVYDYVISKEDAHSMYWDLLLDKNNWTLETGKYKQTVLALLINSNYYPTFWLKEDSTSAQEDAYSLVIDIDINNEYVTFYCDSSPNVDFTVSCKQYNMTPIDKGWYLKDSTATALGLDINQNPSVDDAFVAIKNTYSNRNLLDNGWFLVNQRSQSLYINNTSSYTYCLDRWKFYYGTVDIYSDHIRYTSTPSQSSYKRFLLTGVPLELGKAYTLSIDCDVISYSGTVVIRFANSYAPISGFRSAYITKTGRLLITITNIPTTNIESASFDILVSNTVDDNIKIDIYSAKIEAGSASTLANDTVPDYGEELAKCQRYFVRMKNTTTGDVYVANGVSHSTNACTVLIALPTCMRQNPSFTLSNITDFKLRSNGSAIECSNITSNSSAFPYNIRSLHTTVSSGITIGSACNFMAKAGAYIDFSADL